MPTARKLISICIPAYNSERFIAETVDSVLRQTYHELELIVVDDCSPDGTFDVLRGYDDPRMRLYRNLVNIGAEKNWNKCLGLARGDYVKVLPGDDTLYPECLERQAAVLDDPRNADVTFVYCARDVVDAEGRPVMKASFPGQGRIDRRTLTRKNVRHGMNTVGEPGAVLFRAAASRNIGGFDARLPYIVDLDYWTRLLTVGDAFALSETLCTFRLSNTNWSVVLGNARKTNYLEFIDCLAGKDDVGLTWLEVLAGKARTCVNEMLRKMVYRFIAVRIWARALLGWKKSW